MRAPGVAEQLAVTVGRISARLRARVAVRVAVRATWAWGLGAVPILLAARLHWLRGSMAAFALGAGLAAAILAVLWRARPVPALEAAAAADRALSLADRLTSAISFLAEAAPTPLMRLAIADGAHAGAAVDPRAVVELEVPRSAFALPALLILLLLILRLPACPPASVAVTVPAARPHLVVEPDALEAEREVLRKLARDVGGRDPELARLAQALEHVLQQIDARQLSRNEAFAQLAALETKISAQREATATKPVQQLAALQKALAASKATQKVAEALAHDDLGAAQKELEKLAAQAEARQKEGGEQKDPAEEELARALDRAGRALDEAQKKADAERDRRIEELKEEQRRLQKQHEEHPEDQEAERKLQRNQRELERLERERQAQKEQQRQLQRLSRELQKAAEQLRSKMSPEAMKAAAEALQQMQDEIRKLGSSAQAMAQIAELKEVLRRAGRVESGPGQGQGQPQPGRQGHQGQGKGDERADRLREFDERAGGEPNALLLGGDQPGDTSVLLPLPGQGQGTTGQEPGKDKGGKGDSDPNSPGDGIGHEHDPNVLGERTALGTQHKLIHATGQAGAGPSRSQTILGAAEKGFSSRDYQRVYKDYSAVLEEVMSQEGVPPGYRYYVKRYFQLIRPRE
jgi:hypothetical protein